MTSAGGTTIAIVIAIASTFEWRAGFDEEANRLVSPLLASPLLPSRLLPSPLLPSPPLGSSSVELTIFGLVTTVF